MVSNKAYNHKCTRYTVDPDLLKAGIPVEQLEKSDTEEFQSQETEAHLSKYAQGTDSLRFSSPAEYYPEPEVRSHPPEIELTAEDYKKVLSGALIKLPTNAAQYQGKRIKIVNKDTGSYVHRVLVLFGDRGYWR
jgi:hypothetical protein